MAATGVLSRSNKLHVVCVDAPLIATEMIDGQLCGHGAESCPEFKRETMGFDHSAVPDLKDAVAVGVPSSHPLKTPISATGIDFGPEARDWISWGGAHLHKDGGPWIASVKPTIVVQSAPLTFAERTITAFDFAAFHRAIVPQGVPTR